MKTTPALPEWCQKSYLGHGLMDENGAWLCLNPALLNIFQRPAGEFLGKRFDDILGPASREVFRKAWEDVASGALPSRCMDLEFPAPDGGRLFTDVFLTNFDEAPGLMMFQMLNITRHKETEIALARANGRLHLTAAVAGMGYWEFNFKTQTQHWDDGVFRIYGIRREDFTGRWDTYVHPEDLARGERVVLDVLKNGDSGEQRFRAVRPDGAIRHVHSIFTVERDADGAPSLMTGINFDITDSVVAKETEVRNEASLRLILENLPFPVITASTRAEDEMTLINKEFTRLLGYTLEDMPSAMAWLAKAYPDEGYRKMVVDWWRDAMVVAAKGSGLIENAEFIVTAKDGTRYDIIFNATLVGQFLVVAMRDATEQKKSAAALEAAYKNESILRAQAEQAAKAKVRFLAGVSHEIRTPISALVNISQSMLLESEKHSLPPEFLEHLETVRAGGQYLNLILTNLLDVSAAESGYAPVRATAFYLRDWVEDIGVILEPIARSRSVQIIWHLPEDDNEKFTTDSVRLSQILLNLAHNAVKFSVKPGARIWISMSSTGEGALRLSVADEGPGIPADKLEGLFSEFGQIADTPSTDRGVGLGLAVVRQNLDLLGGKITTRALAPSGICFEIELPGLNKSESCAH